MLAVDAGARYGIHPSLDKLGKKCYFLLIEPETEEFERLIFKYRENSNVTVIDCGLGSENSDMLLEKTSHGALSSCYSIDKTSITQKNRQEQYHVKSRIPIRVRKLDELIDQKIDFIKLDIEGMELEALKGSESILSEVCGIRCEVQLKKTFSDPKSGIFAEIDQWLSQRNFELISIDNLLAGRQLNEWSSSDKDGVLVNVDAIWRNSAKMQMIISGSCPASEARKVICWHFINDLGAEALRILKICLDKGINLSVNNKTSIEDHADDIYILNKLILEHILKIWNKPTISVDSLKVLYEKVFNTSIPEYHTIRYLIDDI